jgi:hypothetical protein
MRTTALNMRDIAFRRMWWAPRGRFFLLRGRQPLRFRRLVGLLRSRSCRARNPVNGLCLGHAPGPAPCFCVNGSRGGGTKSRSVFPIQIWQAAITIALVHPF